MKQKVLFICVHNSARSQMAESFLKKLAGDRFEVESAGLEPGELNPLVVVAMKEAGIDISGNKTQSVFDLFKQGKLYDYIIAVCSKTAQDKCPIFPGISKRLHWPFDDPSGFNGGFEEKLQKTRVVRDVIKEKIEGWLKELN